MTTERDIGALEAQVEAMVKQMDRLEAKVDDLTATMHEFQGGKKAMLWVAGTLGAILGLLAKWLLGKAGV